jgi:hypothetical protein
MSRMAMDIRVAALESQLDECFQALGNQGNGLFDLDNIFKLSKI